EEQRCSLLAMYKGTMDVAESYIAKTGDAKRLTEFKEARTADYDKLLIQESSVGGLKGEVSPEMLMHVTNREIAAGRLGADDPGIRQAALKLAGEPHPSHAELLARGEAREASDVRIQQLMEYVKTATTNKDIQTVTDRIHKEFRAAVTSGQRSTLLALFTVY